MNMEDTRYERLRMDVVAFSTPDIITASVTETYHRDDHNENDGGDTPTFFNP